MRLTLATSIVALACLAAAAPQSINRRIGTSIPIIKRSGLVNANKTVNLEALNTHATLVKGKIKHGLRNYEKNTGSKHPSAVNEHQKRASAGAPLTDGGNVYWFGSIMVGSNPPKIFTVQIDTGSADTFVPASACNLNCVGHTLWDPDSSSTSVDLHKPFTITYGGGIEVTGERYSDNVWMSGFTATNQTLGAALTYPPQFARQNMISDGLLGLGLQQISMFNAPPFFQSLVAQGQVQDSVFSVKLSENDAELYIGGSNPAMYKGDFTYVPLTSEGYWQVNMDSLQGNGQTLLSNVPCIMDTGTTLIVGPTLETDALNNALGGTVVQQPAGKFYSYPCDQMPNISLTLSGTSFPMSAETINLGSVSSGSSDCLLSIMGMDSLSFFVLGDAFLSNFYTSFDLGGLRVGLAELA